MDKAMLVGAPVIGLNDSGGARIQVGAFPPLPPPIRPAFSYTYIYSLTALQTEIAPFIFYPNLGGC